MPIVSALVLPIDEALLHVAVQHRINHAAAGIEFDGNGCVAQDGLIIDIGPENLLKNALQDWVRLLRTAAVQGSAVLIEDDGIKPVLIVELIGGAVPQHFLFQRQTVFFYLPLYSLQLSVFAVAGQGVLSRYKQGLGIFVLSFEGGVIVIGKQAHRRHPGEHNHDRQGN